MMSMGPILAESGQFDEHFLPLSYSWFPPPPLSLSLSVPVRSLSVSFLFL